MRIAVIGTGIAGLTSARLLRGFIVLNERNYPNFEDLVVRVRRLSAQT